MKRRLVTGGCGFIGSNFVGHLLSKYPDDLLVNLDLLTYAGDTNRVKDYLEEFGDKNYQFVKGDICDQKLVEKLFSEHQFDEVINIAAESHVDNSILGPRIFIKTNVTGTLNLLDIALNSWRKNGEIEEGKRFLQVSTDEVYGSIKEGSFEEVSRLNPSNPYSASKASADLLALAYFTTFKMPVLISRCSNNYGPYQDPEKFIPVMITNAVNDRKMPVYGEGLNVRDWLFVKDHCRAIEIILQKGQIGEIYNIADGNEWRNIDLAKAILRILGKQESLIEFVTDRPGHDWRYAIESAKVRKLGWKPEADFETHLETTVNWFKENELARKS